MRAQDPARHARTLSTTEVLLSAFHCGYIEASCVFKLPAEDIA